MLQLLGTLKTKYMKQLKVNEIFGPTIQGEGKSIGKKVMFLRLVGCNLYCIWCDTPYTWNWLGSKFKHREKFLQTAETKLMDTEEVLRFLFQNNIDKGGNTIKSLVISGGEPLIQYKALIPLITKLKKNDWWIEIETNGTIFPTVEFISLVDQINCSPKLSNSNVELKHRYKLETLKQLAALEKTYFKFVISSHEDIMEIKQMILNTGIPNERVFLMPLGINAGQLDKTRELTKNLAEELKVLFSDRQHIVLMGGKRGV